MDSAIDILDFEELIVLAKLDLDANNLSDALIKIKFAHKSTSADSETTIMLARLYARLGLFEKATPLFSEYVDKNPDAIVEKFQLGMTLFDNNDFAKALEIFNSILEAEAYHPPAMFYSTLILSEQGKVDEAISLLESILTNVDSKNLFYSRAHEQLVNLDSDRALKFPLSVASSDNQNSANDAMLN